MNQAVKKLLEWQGAKKGIRHYYIMQSCKLHAKPIIFDSGATHVITPCKSDIIKGWKAEKLSIKG